MKKCLAVLLTATLLLTAVVLPGSAADSTDTYFSYTQDYNANLDGKNNFAICNFNLDTSNSVLTYSKDSEENLTAIAMINPDKKLKVGNTYRITVDFDVSVAASFTGFCLINSQNGDGYNAWHCVNNGDGRFKDPNGTLVDFASALATTGEKTATATFVATNIKATGFTEVNIGFYMDQNDSKFTIDKVTIQEVFNCTADTSDTAAGSATVTNANEAVAAVKNSGFAKGEQAIFKATPNAGYKFNGWYDEAGLVSDKATYTVTLGTNPVNLIARFDINTEAAFTYGFEDNEYVTHGTNGRDWNAWEIDSTTSNTGSASLKKTCRTIPCFVLTPKTADYKLTAGKKYKVDFYAKVDTGFIWATNIQSWGSAEENMQQQNGTLFQEADNQIRSTTFKQYSTTITATEDGYLTIRFFGQGNCTTIWFDDITVTEISPAGTVAAAYDFNGTAIRAAQGEVKQALRFKTTVNKSVLADAAAAGQTVQEYGFVVFRKDFLNGKELTLNSSYTADGTTQTAITKAAYVAGSTDIIFKENETEKTFTAALQGINESNYDKEYAVRVYVKLSDSSIIYPNLTQYMSVLTCAELAFNATTKEAGVGYTDTNGTHWQESYATRLYLYTAFGQSRGWTAPVQ